MYEKVTKKCYGFYSPVKEGSSHVSNAVYGTAYQARTLGQKQRFAANVCCQRSDVMMFCEEVESHHQHMPGSLRALLLPEIEAL